MRPRLVLAVAALVCLAGCSAVPSNPTEESTTTARETTAERLSFPEPPVDLTNETAKAVALDHEEAYVHNRLRNASELTYFSVRAGYVMSVESEVLNESDGGVYVRVQMPYSTGTENSTGDGGTNAVYFVSEDTVERVRGDEVSP